MPRVPTPVFSLGELLTLLDVEHVPLVSAPFPAELEGISRELSFAMSAPHLLPPRGARLSATPILCSVRIDDFRAAGSATWKHVHDYIIGYLADTLTKVPRGEGLPAYRTYKGHGVTVGFVHTPPSSGGALFIELVVIRDESPAQTIARAFGVELPSASALDRNWRDVATTREMHVEAAVVGDEVWMRTNARYGAAQSDASRCASWVRFWLRLWESYIDGAMSLSSVTDRTLAEGERATRHPVGRASVVTIEVGGERRRDQFEVHMPRVWLGDRAVDLR